MGGGEHTLKEPSITRRNKGAGDGEGWGGDVMDTKKNLYFKQKKKGVWLRGGGEKSGTGGGKLPGATKEPRMQPMAKHTGGETIATPNMKNGLEPSRVDINPWAVHEARGLGIGRVNIGPSSGAGSREPGGLPKRVRRERGKNFLPPSRKEGAPAGGGGQMKGGGGQAQPRRETKLFCKRAKKKKKK